MSKSNMNGILRDPNVPALREPTLPSRDLAVGGDPQFGDQEPTVRDFIDLLLRYKYLILTSVLVFFLGAWGYVYFADKLYSASASLEVKGYAPVLADAQTESLLQADTRRMDYKLTTTAKLKQAGIANRVLDDPELGRDVTEYLQSRSGSLSKKLSYLWNVVTGTKAEEKDPISLGDLHYRHKTSLLKSYLGLIDVNPVKDTSIVKISAVSTDNKLAQKLANAHAEKFIEHLQDERRDSMLATLRIIQDQANALRVKVENAEKELTQYVANNELIAASDPESANVSIQQVGRLSEHLAQVTAKRVRSESILRELEDRAASEPMGLDDPSIKELQLSLNQAKAELAALSSQVTGEFPTVIELQARMKSLVNIINRERKRKLDDYRLQYSSDLKAEKELQKQIEIEKEQANEISKSLVEYNVLLRSVETLRELYQAVLKQEQELQISAANGTINVTISDYATLPKGPISPRRKIIMIVGAFLGLAVGIGMALLLDLANNTIQHAEQAQAELGLPFLGIVPSFEDPSSVAKNSKSVRKKIEKFLPIWEGGEADTFESETTSKSIQKSSTNTEVIAAAAPFAIVSEALRTIRAGILLSSADNPSRVVMVTSAKTAEGKSTLSANLAATLAQAGHRTLLVDADLRKSSLHTFFNVSGNGPGLADVLSGLKEATDVTLATPIKDLHLLLAGTRAPNPAELVGSQTMADLVESLKESYDYVIVDAPPVLPIADALMLSRQVDSVVLVVRSRKTEKHVAQEARRRLLSVGARILGVVLNDVDLRRPEHYTSVLGYGTYGEDISSVPPLGGKANAA